MTKIEERYCVYMQQHVISCGWNNDGQCVCLNCDKKQCDRENCEVAQNRQNKRRMMGTNSFGIMSNCNECLDAKMRSAQEHKR